VSLYEEREGAPDLEFLATLLGRTFPEPHAARVFAIFGFETSLLSLSLSLSLEARE
jgi:hypothetical protein